MSELVNSSVCFDGLLGKPMILMHNKVLIKNYYLNDNCSFDTNCGNIILISY